MPNNYPAKTRKVTLRTLTNGGWITGITHVPVRRTLCESLNQNSGLICLKEVWLQNRNVRLPQFGLRSKGIQVIVAEDPEGIAEISASFVKASPRKVIYLSDHCSISGYVMIPKNLGVSDFFSRQHKFVAFSRATLKVQDSTDREVFSQAFDEVLVNCDHLVGVSSEDNW